MNKPKINIKLTDGIQEMHNIVNESVDVILTDPPYLYLKNQKLDKQFDENLFFKECHRVLKKDGFIILFGRGTSFYRWNTILADLGFIFKEEIIWNKSYCTSPLMNISRVHETVSIHTKGKGTINKVKIPYLEMKCHDIDSIITDIKRLKSTFKNSKSMNSVLEYLENNKKIYTDVTKSQGITRTKELKNLNRCSAVMGSMSEGMVEKSIIRTDRVFSDKFTKFGVNCDKRNTGDRCVNVMQSIDCGFNEKSIIKEVGNRYIAIHPTEKPVRLLERLLMLVIKGGDNIVLDPFGGSFSTMEACINLKLCGISYEIDDEYFSLGEQRIVSKLKEVESLLF